MRLLNADAIRGGVAAIEVGKGEIGALLASLVTTIPVKRTNLVKAKLDGSLNAMQLETMEASLAQDVNLYDMLSFLHNTMERPTDDDYTELQERAAEEWPDEPDGAVKS